jgi:hypothetical protein
MSPAGIAAAKPINPERRPSLPFAETNSSSFLTNVGTSAALLTLYVRANTNEINANAKSESEFSREIIATTVAQRKALTKNTVNLRPPGIRSMTGPMNGAITANGAKLTAKNKSTRLRAASGLIDKNKESASATANAASPHAINA